jgi:DNA-binding beta-propeller fold protein YncE
VSAGGVLSPKNPATVSVYNPQGVAVSPDGKYVYVADGRDQLRGCERIRR